MATRGKKLAIAATILFGLPVVGFVAVFNYRDCKASKTFLEYHVPRGYRGWVAVRHGVPSAPPLPFVENWIGGTYTLTIPQSGCLETSSPIYPAFHQERFFVDDVPTGVSVDIHANGEGCELFYVEWAGGKDVVNREYPCGCK